jgi:hypothetical protein
LVDGVKPPMNRKWMVALVALLVAIGFAGVGYGTLVYQSIATISGNAYTGSFALIWVSPSVAAPLTYGCGPVSECSPPPPATETCYLVVPPAGGSPGIGTNTLILTITNFNGGDVCLLIGTLEDTGSLGGSLSPAIVSPTSDFRIDPYGPTPLTITPGTSGEVVYGWTFTALSGNLNEGMSDTISIVIQGGAT